MVKAGKVYATATEDMDALTFGSNVLLRHMTFSEARKMPIQEFHLSKVLEGLELSHKEVRPYMMLHLLWKFYLTPEAYMFVMCYIGSRSKS